MVERESKLTSEVAYLFYLFQAINVFCLFVRIYFSIFLTLLISHSFLLNVFYFSVRSFVFILLLFCFSFFQCLVLLTLSFSPFFRTFLFHFLGRMLFSNNNGKHLWCCLVYFIWMFFFLLLLVWCCIQWFKLHFWASTILNFSLTLAIPLGWVRFFYFGVGKVTYLHSISMFQLEINLFEYIFFNGSRVCKYSKHFVSLNYVVCFSFAPHTSKEVSATTMENVSWQRVTPKKKTKQWSTHSKHAKAEWKTAKNFHVSIDAVCENYSLAWK